MTWNCHHGECRGRAAHPGLLRPDVVVLQECSEPAPPADGRCLWFPPPTPIHGNVGVVSRSPWTVEAGPHDPAASPPWVYPVRVTGPAPFHLLAVWAHPVGVPLPSYVQCLLDGLDHYEGFLRAAPSVVIGDFNSHTHFPPPVGPYSHGALVSRLHELGIVSAFHHAPQHGGVVAERPTHYHNWLRARPFHIDYCFIPGAWVPLLGAVALGTFDEWVGAGESDHVPLWVELNVEPATASPSR